MSNAAWNGLFLIIIIVIGGWWLMKLDVFLSKRMAERRGEKSIYHYVEEQAVVENQWQADQDVKQRSYRDMKRVKGYFQWHADQKGITVSKALYTMLTVPYHLERWYKTPPHKAIPFQDDCDYENFKQYMYQPPLDPYLYIEVNYLIHYIDQQLDVYMGQDFFYPRLNIEKADLFWKYRRVVNHYIPAVEKFYKEVAKNKNHPYHGVFPNITKMYHDSRIQNIHDCNAKTGAYAPERCVGFVLEQIQDQKTQRWMFFFNQLIERLAFCRNISYKQAFAELSNYMTGKTA